MNLPSYLIIQRPFHKQNPFWYKHIVFPPFTFLTYRYCFTSPIKNTIQSIELVTFQIRIAANLLLEPNPWFTFTLRAIIWVLAKPVTHGIIRIMKLSLLGKSWRRVIKNEGTFN